MYRGIRISGIGRHRATFGLKILNGMRSVGYTRNEYLGKFLISFCRLDCFRVSFSPVFLLPHSRLSLSISTYALRSAYLSQTPFWSSQVYSNTLHYDGNELENAFLFLKPIYCKAIMNDNLIVWCNGTQNCKCIPSYIHNIKIFQ